jgi:hypothetical protein
VYVALTCFVEQPFYARNIRLSNQADNTISDPYRPSENTAMTSV